MATKTIYVNLEPAMLCLINRSRIYIEKAVLSKLERVLSSGPDTYYLKIAANMGQEHR